MKAHYCLIIVRNVDVIENKFKGSLFTKGNVLQIENQINLALYNTETMSKMAVTLKNNIFKYYVREVV